MYNKLLDLRLNVVRHYLENKESLRKTAGKFKVNYWNVYEWVKSYQKKGAEGILSTYARPSCRTDKSMEEKIALLKEKTPALTVRKAKEILGKEGIKISLKGIWGIWRRYGYAGFIKGNMTNEFIEYCPWTKEAKNKLARAKELLSMGKLKESSQILNSIPILPKNDLIHQIPENLLSLRRRVEKIEASFGQMPIHSYLKLINDLYCKLRQQNLNYSALRVGIVRVIALSWLGKPEEQLRVIKELKEIIYQQAGKYRHKGSYLLFEPRFTLLINEGITLASVMEIAKAKNIADECRRLLITKKSPSPYFLFNIGRLCTFLEEYQKAEHWFLMAYDGVSEAMKRHIKGILARISLNKCEYKKAITLAESAEFGLWVPKSYMLIFRALLSLMSGLPQKAITLAVESLSLSKKEELNNAIWSASLIMASAHSSIGNNKEAINILKRTLRILKKNTLKREQTISKILISSIHNTHNMDTVIPLDKNLLPTIKLALLLKNGRYFKALSFARENYLMHYFYNYIFFAPDIIIDLLKKGNRTELPRAILKLPSFNKEAPVFNIKFLGDLVVFKNQEYMPIKLRPKDSAFLIYLCTKAMEPNKSIDLDEIYANFWPKSETAVRNFSHLLVRVKKALKIPSHLLTITRMYGLPKLVNEGVYFTSDYQEFEQGLAQAKALERAGEWAFARKEYLRAFRLFRGEPFKKNFDEWSVDMRFRILTQLETEAINFAKSCLEHKNKKDASRILLKVLKIIPDSEEIQRTLKNIE